MFFFIPERTLNTIKFRNRNTINKKKSSKSEYQRIAYEVVLQLFGYSNIVSGKIYLRKGNVKISIEL